VLGLGKETIEEGDKMNKPRYTIKQLVEFAKNEMYEFAFATEEQLDKVIEIFDNEGLAGDDLFTIWEEMNEPNYFELI